MDLFWFQRHIIACLNASICTSPSLDSAPPSSTGVIEKPAAQQGELKMDPTMGQAVTGQATFGGEEALHEPNTPGMSAYLTVGDMQADQAGGTEASGVVGDLVTAAADIDGVQLVAEVIPPAPSAPPAPPAVVYPSGHVDFNKPFEVFDENNPDDYLTDVQILTVLHGNGYPIVVVGRNHGEQVILQFDTDGDEVNGEYKAENIETGPRTLYVRLYRDGRDVSADTETYDSQDGAEGAYTSDRHTLIGAFPVVIPPRDGTPAQSEFVDVTGDDHGIEDDEEHDDIGGSEVIETLPVPTNPGARYVNGKLFAPGDSVRAHRSGFGERVGKVLKTREHSYQTLFVSFNDGTNPYWALNKNIRTY
jgi:hypothetical protein